jgi:hypothetical protein
MAGILFVGLAAANAVLILEAYRASPGQNARRNLILAHRVGGYSFVIFLSVMAS